jgi:hypothetical protein
VQDLVNQEKTSGNAVGTSLGTATGQVPTQTSSSGGGCYVSTVFASKGLIGKRVIRLAAKNKVQDPSMYYFRIGYCFYGPSLARFILRHRLAQQLMLSPTRAILYEELRWAGVKLKRKFMPVVYHSVFHYGSTAIGFVATLFGRGFETRDTEMRQFVQKEGLYFYGTN